jgi:hypothetical protein
MDITKMPIIGKVTTKVLTYFISYPDGRKEPYDMPAETYSVVDVYEHNGHKFYVTNIWHKEHKRSPLTIVDDIVEKYEPVETRAADGTEIEPSLMLYKKSTLPEDLKEKWVKYVNDHGSTWKTKKDWYNAAIDFIPKYYIPFGISQEIDEALLSVAWELLGYYRLFLSKNFWSKTSSNGNEIEDWDFGIIKPGVKVRTTPTHFGKWDYRYGTVLEYLGRKTIFKDLSGKEYIDIEGNAWRVKWDDGEVNDVNENLIERVSLKDYNKRINAGDGGVVTYRQKYNKKYGYNQNESHDLNEIAKDTGVSKKGLQQIYNKGIGAYKTNPQSVRPNVKSKEQWAKARVYSAVMGGKAARIDANELKMNNGGEILLAPNGKPSNLTPEQYRLVRTTAFKKWFGDWENSPETASKVVDENGEPLQVYHKTDYRFTVFDKEKLGSSSQWGTAYFGFYFSNKYERISYGKRAIKCFLNIRNPYLIESETYSDYDLEYKRFDVSNFSKNDGVIIKAMRLGGNEKADKHFVAFEPTQIKLSDGSNTTFDGSNPDIRFEEGGYLHGSQYNFCDTGFKLGAGKGQGENLWGRGLYFTKDKDLATYYAKFIKSEDVTDKLQQKVAEKLGFKTYSDIPFDYEKKGIKTKYGQVLKFDLFNQYLKAYVDKSKDNGVVYKVTLFSGKDKSEYKIIDFSGENSDKPDKIKKDLQDLRTLIATLVKNRRKYTNGVKSFFIKKDWEFDSEKYSENYDSTLKYMRRYLKDSEHSYNLSSMMYNLAYDIKKLFKPDYSQYAKDYSKIYNKQKVLPIEERLKLSDEVAYYQGVQFTEFIKDAGYSALTYWFSPSTIPMDKEHEHNARAIVVFDEKDVEIDKCIIAANGTEIPERYKNIGFTEVGQKKKSTIPSKKWMVLAKKGDKYKVVHGGYKGMEDYSQHHDDDRRKRFWQRMGGINSEKANDKFSPLYWHKKFGTWEDGGPIESEYVTYKELTYPSGSTLDFYKGKIYLIGDDAKYISILDTDFNEIDTIPLFEHADHRIPKKEKRDIETSTIVQINGQDILALIGSGSKNKRRRIYLVPLNTEKVIEKEISTVKYGKFIDKLYDNGIAEVNIEGSALTGTHLLLSNRGNKANPSNYLIATEKGFWTSQKDAGIILTKLNLPDGLGISELAYDKGVLFFTASVENTSNAFDDGEIGDSYLGYVEGIDILIGEKSITPDHLINLAEYDKAFVGHKVEGICIENSDNGYVIDLVSDNDDGKSTMFKIKLYLDK